MNGIVTLTASDGHKLSAYRAEPAGKARAGLVVVQEIFGVNRHIRDVCDGFAADGYLAIAPSLFDRVEHGTELAYTGDDIARGRDLRAKITWDAVFRDVGAAIEAAASAGRVGVVGYCWGGSIAWRAATTLRGAACAVGYYGGMVAEFKHEQPKVPVMLHFGATDASIPLADVDAVRKAHPAVPIHVYPGAGHGFNCDHRASFNADAAALARSRTMGFFADHLG